MSRTHAAMSRTHPERGSGVVFAIGLLAVIGSLLTLVAGLGAAVIARHRAEAAADLAALAAVTGPATGVVDCTRAASVAAAGGAVLTTCLPASDGSVTVTVAIPVTFPGSGPMPARRSAPVPGQRTGWWATGRARAGSS